MMADNSSFLAAARRLAAVVGSAWTPIHASCNTADRPRLVIAAVNRGTPISAHIANALRRCGLDAIPFRWPPDMPPGSGLSDLL